MSRIASTALALALVASPAWAVEGESIRLDYQAPDGCPDQAAFEALVRSRTPHLTFVGRGEARTFDVSIDAGPPTTGRLVVRRDGRIDGSRQIQAASCGEVTEALALMVALAVDPTALLPPPIGEPAAADPALPSPASAPIADAIPPLPSSQQEQPRAPDSVSAPRYGVHPPGPALVRPVPARTLYLGADLAVVTNVSPNAIVGAAPYAGWRGTRRGWMEPEVRIAFIRGSNANFAVAGGTASFTWTVGQADGCLPSWPEGPVHVLACARLEAGVLDGTGGGVASARSANRGWLSAGPLLRFEWTVVAALFLDADVAVMGHVTEYHFYFGPNATIYTVPLGGLEAAAGLGVHFL